MILESVLLLFIKVNLISSEIIVISKVFIYGVLNWGCIWVRMCGKLWLWVILNRICEIVVWVVNVLVNF